MAQLGKRTFPLTCLMRLAIVPGIGYLFVRHMDSYGMLPKDPLFAFVAFLQHAMPSAVTLSAICTIHNSGVAEVSTLLFWMYVTCLPFVGAFLALAFGTIA